MNTLAFEIEKCSNIECVSVHSRNGDAKLYSSSKLEEVANNISSNLTFLFAVINLYDNPKPLIIYDMHELLGVLNLP